MKKVLLFCVVAMALASCAPKKAEEAPKTDSTTVKVDTAKVDTAKVDTTVKK
jgi:PBP1b-binding outer membrane lipoprotein LpoB